MYAITISSKGQLVLPKKIRTALGTNAVFVKVSNENQVVISPIVNIGGILSNYKKSDQEDSNVVRNKAWLANTNRYSNNKEQD